MDGRTDDDDDDDDSRSYVRPLLQLETVTSVLVIRAGKQFSFQITTERGCQIQNDDIARYCRVCCDSIIAR